MTKLVVVCLLLAVPALADEPPKKPHVDLVIALDVSGSMRGLIDATRVKLWDVVRLLGQAQPQPEVRVGLITFGGKYYPPADGWVRRDLDLTTDLDAVSQRLFSLSVRGSEEYVARTVQTAVRQMSWDQDPSSLKILFVAGNESAEQDPQVSLASALGEARQRGIHVNSIYCGGADDGVALAWRRVASMGNGEFANIDHHQSQLARVTPYDAELGRLSQSLSHTYVGYGDGAREHQANQLAQDQRASTDGPQVAASRAAAKASPAYNNDSWDLVDAYAHKKAVEKLPPSLAGMSEGERAGFLRQRLDERKQLQQRISDLSGKRDAFLATGADHDAGSGHGASQPPVSTVTATATAAPPAAPAGNPVAVVAPPRPAAPRAKAAHRSMDEALVGTVQKQAANKGYSFAR